MSNPPPDSEPPQLKPGKFPPWLVKTGLIVSVLPFLGAGAFMLGRLFRTTYWRNGRLIIPFTLFVVLFCALPVVQIFLTLRKMKSPAPPAPAKDTRFDPLAHVEIREVADGKEFFFPALRAPETGFFIFMLALFWSAMVWALIYTTRHFLLPALLIGVGALTVLACVNRWYNESRVTIHAKGLRLSRRGIFFNSTRSYEAGEIASIDNEPGTAAGLQIYYRLHMVLRDRRKITLATRIRGKPGADWLAREMTRALGRTVS